MRIEYTKEYRRCRLCAFQISNKEGINICDCKRLGYVGDVDFDMDTGCLLAIIVPGPGCFCGFLVREKEYIIPYSDICQVGRDIILVKVDLEKTEEKCKI